MGMGLIYPIFPKLLFDQSMHFFAPEVGGAIRGMWLGVLFFLMPAVQFLSLPIWGTISDEKGRRNPLLYSLLLTMLGYLISIFGVIFYSIFFLLLSRVILGISSGNLAIVQASIADISKKEEKTKNFSLYAMAIGAGFALGPFIGGALAIYDYSLPFSVSLGLTTVNLIVALVLFQETFFGNLHKKMNFVVGIKNLKKAWTTKKIRIFFLCTFLVGFAWSYFMEFAPVYLIKNFGFSAAQIGIFYGSMGAIYALNTGLLLRPILAKYKPELLLFCGCVLGGGSILTIPFYPNYYWLIPFVLFFSYVVGVFYPTFTTLVSNNAAKDMQGEALGILGSVNTAAQAISVLVAGFFVGLHPSLIMYVGGIVMISPAFIMLWHYGKKIF